jgi:methyltransferase
MTLLHAILLLVAAQRGAELMLAARNTRRLRAVGAVEIDAASYPLFVLLHGGWLAAMAIAIPADTAPLWPLIGVFTLLQLGRAWVIATLGRRWTTRIIVLPHTKPVTSGPYRWCRHPNYLVVAGEIAVLPLAFGAVPIAAIFSLLNATLLARRILIENAALQTSVTSLQPAAPLSKLHNG